MLNESPSAAYAEKAGAQLQRLSHALDLPVSAFFENAPLKASAAEAVELFRLWLAIRDPENRQALLQAARELVEREADAPLAAE